MWFVPLELIKKKRPITPKLDKLEGISQKYLSFYSPGQNRCWSTMERPDCTPSILSLISQLSVLEAAAAAGAIFHQMFEKEKLKEKNCRNQNCTVLQLWAGTSNRACVKGWASRAQRSTENNWQHLKLCDSDTSFWSAPWGGTMLGSF